MKKIIQICIGILIGVTVAGCTQEEIETQPTQVPTIQQGDLYVYASEDELVDINQRINSYKQDTSAQIEITVLKEAENTLLQTILTDIASSADVYTVSYGQLDMLNTYSAISSAYSYGPATNLTVYYNAEIVQENDSFDDLMQTIASMDIQVAVDENIPYLIHSEFDCIAMDEVSTNYDVLITSDNSLQLTRYDTSKTYQVHLRYVGVNAKSAYPELADQLAQYITQ